MNEEYCEPAVVRGPQESCVVLGNVYHELESKSQRDLFGDAIKILFESTPIVRPNSGYLRSILELLALLKPYQAKSLLRRHLFARSLLGMKDGGIDLHTLLLIVNSKYDVDDALMEFVERTARQTEDFGYLLTCLRTASQSGGAEYLRVLDTVLLRVKESRNAILLARELGDVMYLYGSRPFDEWYSTKLQNAPNPSYISEGFKLFEEALKKIVFRNVDIGKPANDPYRTLIAAQLYANDRFYTAKEIVAVGRLHVHVGIDETVQALVNVWNRIKTKCENRTLPWYFTRGYSSADPYLLSSGRSPEVRDSVELEESDEVFLVELVGVQSSEQFLFPRLAHARTPPDEGRVWDQGPPAESNGIGHDSDAGPCLRLEVELHGDRWHVG